jgi:MFS family permease
MQVTMPEATAPATAPLVPLRRHRDFLLFWSGETVSLFGSQVTFLALPLTAILVLHASPFELGLLNAGGFLPFLFVSLPAGAWLDRRRKRPILLLSNLVRALIVGLVPLAAVFGWVRIELLYAVAVAHGVMAVVYDVGWLSFVPSLVGHDHVVAANARLQASASAAQVGGPGVAGVLIQALSAPIALLADAVSFVFSAATLALIRGREPDPEARDQRHLLAEVTDGLRLTFGNATLRAMAINAGAYNLFDQVIYTAFLLYAVGPLGLSPGLVGAVIGVGSIGGLLGAVVSERMADRVGIGPTMIVMSFVAGSTAVAIPFVTGPQVIVTTLLGAVFFVQGFGVGVTNVHFVSLRQSTTPPNLLGRMNASYRTVSFGAIPVGAFLGGALAEAAGLRAALLAGALGLLVSPLLILLSPVRNVKELPRTPAAMNGGRR